VLGVVLVGSTERVTGRGYHYYSSEDFDPPPASRAKVDSNGHDLAPDPITTPPAGGDSEWRERR
jgi:hypothetical protein